MEEYYELSVSRLNGRLPPDLQEYITEAQWKTIGERHSSADARGNVKAGMIVCMTCCLTSCCYEVFSTYYKGQEIAKEYEALNRELFNGRRVMEFKSGEFKSRLYLGQTPRGLEKNAPVQPMMQGQMGQQMMYAQAVPQQAYPYNAPVAQPMPNDPKAGSRTMAITIPPNATPGSNMTVMSPEGMQIMVQVPPGSQPGSMIHVNY